MYVYGIVMKQRRIEEKDAGACKTARECNAPLISSFISPTHEFHF